MKNKFNPPRKKNTLADRIAREKKIQEAVAEHFNQDKKIRIRMGYAYIVAMADAEGVNLNAEQIKAVVDTMSDTMDEYYQMVKEDGEEVADSKLYQKVCAVLGDDPSECDYQFEKLFTPKEEN